MNNEKTKTTHDASAIAELTALVREKCPDAVGETVEELLAALLPLAPDEISQNQDAVRAVHSALQSTSVSSAR